MARIVIRNLGKSVEVKDFSKSILQHVQESQIDWMYSCGGKGNCTTCKAIVIEGENNLSEFSLSELRYRKQGLLKDKERLACQAKPKGNIIVEIPDEYKLPHLSYLT